MNGDTTAMVPKCPDTSVPVLIRPADSSIPVPKCHNSSDNCSDTSKDESTTWHDSAACWSSKGSHLKHTVVSHTKNFHSRNEPNRLQMSKFTALTPFQAQGQGLG